MVSRIQMLALKSLYEKPNQTSYSLSGNGTNRAQLIERLLAKGLIAGRTRKVRNSVGKGKTVYWLTELGRQEVELTMPNGPAKDATKELPQTERQLPWH